MMNKRFQINNIYLKPLSNLHNNSIYESLNNEKIVDTYPVSMPYTKEDANLYVDWQILGRRNGCRFAFAITAYNQFLGVCALYDVNQSTSKAKVYYWIAVEFWNQGIATKAINELINYSKEKLKITHLKSGVLERNLASRRVLEKNGFSVKNTLKNEGKYHEKFIGETFVEMELDL